MKKIVVSFGEMLWDMLPGGKQLGGAPCNFAYRINSLGDRGQLVSRLGHDSIGDEALAILERLSMNSNFIQRDAQYPTGTVDITFDTEGQPSYIINPDVAYDHIAITDALLETAAKADCLCFGTLAQRCEQSCRTLAAMLDAAENAIKLLDINLRKDCYSPQIISQSLEHTNVLKLNDEELVVLADMEEMSGGDTIGWAEQLIERYQLRYCLVTLGERGVYVATDDGERIYIPGYAVDMVDPCGAGDAFTAGFVHLMLRKHPAESCANLGNALGAIVATQQGATTPIAAYQIDRLLTENSRRIIDPSLELYTVEMQGDITWKI